MLSNMRNQASEQAFIPVARPIPAVRRRLRALGWLAVLAPLAAQPAFAEQKPNPDPSPAAPPAAAPAPAPAPSLDELLNLPAGKPKAGESEPKPAPHPTAKPEDHANPKPAAGLDPGLRRELTMREAQDEFEAAVAEMLKAADRLQRAKDPSAPTQRLQQSVLDKLDQVIAAARRQQQQQKQQSSSSSSQHQKEQDKRDTGSKQNQPKDAQAQAQGQQPKPVPGQKNKPEGVGDPDREQVSPGSVREVDPLKDIEEMRREWGHLPPRVRDELLQSLRERISPIYRRSTEEYFRLLAREGRSEEEN